MIGIDRIEKCSSIITLVYRYSRTSRLEEVRANEASNIKATQFISSIVSDNNNNDSQMGRVRTYLILFL